MNKTCTAPRLVPPSSSSGAPAARSDIPSPSRSPISETDEPNLSPSASDGPLADRPLISVMLFAVPSEFMNTTCSAPREPLWPAASLTPPTRSGTPLRSKSPTIASDCPNCALSRSGSMAPRLPGSFVVYAGYALLWACASAPPNETSRWCSPGVCTRTASLNAPGSASANTSRSPSRAPCPAGPSSRSNETSAPGPHIDVPPPPSTERSAGPPDASKCTIQSPPT